jgi:sugar phosphate isomerase/epimerase
LPADFADEIEQYAAGDCPAIEFWLTKLEQFVARHDLATVRALLDQHGLQTPAASFQGGLFQPDNAGFQDAWSSLLRRLALCQSLGVETLVVAGDIFDPLSQPLIERVRDRLQRIADAAATTNRKVAFEFQAAATFANNLETTLALISEIAHPALGICLDAFHFHVGPSKTEDLARLTADHLFHVQLCDLADTARELATDQDRILPGEGDVPIAAILDRLTQIGYSKAVSVETMNPQLWQVPPRQFGQIATKALRNALQTNANSDARQRSQGP